MLLIVPGTSSKLFSNISLNLINFMGMVLYTTMEQDGYQRDFLYGKPVVKIPVTAPKMNLKPGVIVSLDFVAGVGWRAVRSECGTFLRSSIPLFTLNFSAN